MNAKDQDSKNQLANIVDPAGLSGEAGKESSAKYLLKSLPAHQNASFCAETLRSLERIFKKKRSQR